MAMATLSAARERAEINITPMIDVLLVLIIIFMIITPLRPEGLPTVVPQPAADPPARVSHEIVITVRPHGAVLLNREPMEVLALKARLAVLFASHANQAIFVRGEGDLSFQDIAAVIDLARSAGVYRVALMGA